MEITAGKIFTLTKQVPRSIREVTAGQFLVAFSGGKMMKLIDLPGHIVLTDCKSAENYIFTDDEWAEIDPHPAARMAYKGVIYPVDADAVPQAGNEALDNLMDVAAAQTVPVYREDKLAEKYNCPLSSVMDCGTIVTIFNGQFWLTEKENLHG